MSLIMRYLKTRRNFAGENNTWRYTLRNRHPIRVDASIVSTLGIGKVCLCDTNWRLYHKDPCPEGEMNYSKVVIKKTERI